MEEIISEKEVAEIIPIYQGEDLKPIERTLWPKKTSPPLCVLFGTHYDATLDDQGRRVVYLEKPLKEGQNSVEEIAAKLGAGIENPEPKSEEATQDRAGSQPKVEVGPRKEKPERVTEATSKEAIRVRLSWPQMNFIAAARKLIRESNGFSDEELDAWRLEPPHVVILPEIDPALALAFMEHMKDPTSIPGVGQDTNTIAARNAWTRIEGALVAAGILPS